MSNERREHWRPAEGARDDERSGALDVGDDVEVFSAYERTWATGFSIAQVLRDRRYRLRRSADGSLLPEPTGSRDLRRQPQAGQH